MTKRKIIFLLSISIAVLFLTSPSTAWDNKKTHKDLSFQASKSSNLGTGAILENIGLKGALTEALNLNGNTKQVIELLQEGAFLEDAGEWWNAVGIGGTARYMNHFHNPLKPWERAGLADIQSGESALLWAQDKKKQESALAGDQSWPTIRDHFYYALTLKKGDDRQAYFARTFIGLGHQMHLIQDMAVPAHVRNDAHPGDALLGSNYLTGDLLFETYAKNRVGMINDLASNPIFPQVDLTKSPDGKASITQNDKKRGLI